MSNRTDTASPSVSDWGTGCPSGTDAEHHRRAVSGEAEDGRQLGAAHRVGATVGVERLARPQHHLELVQS